MGLPPDNEIAVKQIITRENNVDKLVTKIIIVYPVEPLFQISRARRTLDRETGDQF